MRRGDCRLENKNSGGFSSLLVIDNKGVELELLCEVGT